MLIKNHISWLERTFRNEDEVKELIEKLHKVRKINAMSLTELVPQVPMGVCLEKNWFQETKYLKNISQKIRENPSYFSSWGKKQNFFVLSTFPESP